jgi:Molybdate transporter of MFS superfamily
VLFGFGIFLVSTGLFYGLPIPVQPMKAVSAVILTDGLRPGEVAAAGMMLSIILLVLGITGWIGCLARAIPQSVSAGLQLGLGLLMGVLGVKLMLQVPWVAFPGPAVPRSTLPSGTHRARGIRRRPVGDQRWRDIHRDRLRAQPPAPALLSRKTGESRRRNHQMRGDVLSDIALWLINSGRDRMRKQRSRPTSLEVPHANRGGKRAALVIYPRRYPLAYP